MELAKNFDWKTAENHWYQYWKKNNYFSSTPDEREPYTIVIPPPNVTGVLHMGHMLNNTIQDVLIRKARMQGKNACWVPGTDHASIATEAKVVALLKEKGIEKNNLTREEFLKHAWEWKEKYGGIILKQLEKLGASCDWNRTKFTMDKDLSEAVYDTFIDLYNKGHIYRGIRMVNWDPQGLTALSDEEVIFKENDTQLVYLKYALVDDNSQYIAVATTRPETIMGDVAVCVNPNDDRYKHLIGKKCIIPLVNREVPIIADEYVDITFGTGALKITPAHDINDYKIGAKYQLPSIDVLTPDGKIAEIAKLYVGMDRFKCRKTIIKDLQENDLIFKIENTKNKVGYSERTNAVIEPKLSMQWFLKMDTLSKPALDYVMDDKIKLFPDKYKNTYRHWMENVHDWCISRQLWWGQQIPAWYDNKGNTVVCKTKEEAIILFKKANVEVSEKDIRQDEDVLDTWFSSWLWPLTVFDTNIIKNGWENANKDLKYYYPTNDLVTAPEILFFWVARMAIAGITYTGQKPFNNVYLTGIVRDKLGRKMSKSLGNSPDPLKLIEDFGADGVRVGMLLCSPAGNDLLFDESYCEQGRNFTNKIWNAYRLIYMWQVDGQMKTSSSNMAANDWFETILNNAITEINSNYTKLRLSEALMNTYKLVWDDFCAWYLEMIKPNYVNGVAEKIDANTYNKAIYNFEQLLKLLHPFMPFLTEELWQTINKRNEKQALIISEWPVANENIKSNNLIHTQKLITEIRNIRNAKGISPKEKLILFNPSKTILQNELTCKLAGLNEINNSVNNDNTVTIQIDGLAYQLQLNIQIDKAQEKERIEKEIKYLQGFLTSVMAKLGNQKFVANAKPEIIANETKKKEDAEQKLAQFEKELISL